MWKKNLFFIGLLLIGGAALAGSLFPEPEGKLEVPFDPVEYQRNDFRDPVARVDASFRQDWSAAGVQQAPRANDLTLIRRLSLALMGTVPSLEEIRQFEAYEGPEPIQWYLSRILHDRRHADYLAERLARAYVGTEDGPFLVYRRRRFVTWLSDEIALNTPYDQLARKLIADEGLWTDHPATNFITVTIEQGERNRPNPERLAGRVSRAFLGLRLDCAKCHDHPLYGDEIKWKQTDFHGLAAFFGQARQGFTGVKDDPSLVYEMEKRRGADKVEVEPGVPFLEELLPAEGSRRERLARWVTDPGNPYFGEAIANRMWALMTGRPLVEPIDDLDSVDPETAQRFAPARVKLKMLAEDFVAHGHDLRRLIRVIAATEAFQLDSATDQDLSDAQMRDAEQTWAVYPLSPLRPEQIVGTVLQAASLQTIDSESHILVRLATTLGINEFVKRYGDAGTDEFDASTGTIPQRLLLMNGNLIKEKTSDSILNAATRIAFLAPDDEKAVEIAYLVLLTRRPTPAESRHFAQRLAGTKNKARHRRLEDLYWTLINSSEFALNH